MRREDIVSEIIDNIDVKSNNFSMAYNIVEYAVDYIFNQIENKSCNNCKYSNICGIHQYILKIKEEDMSKFSCNSWEIKDEPRT